MCDSELDEYYAKMYYKYYGADFSDDIFVPTVSEIPTKIEICTSDGIYHCHKCGDATESCWCLKLIEMFPDHKFGCTENGLCAHGLCLYNYWNTMKDMENENRLVEIKKEQKIKMRDTFITARKHIQEKESQKKKAHGKSKKSPKKMSRNSKPKRVDCGKY